MATTILITCPSCKKQLKVPSAIQGKKVRCKECGAAIRVGTVATDEDAKDKAAASAPEKAAPKYETSDGPMLYGFMSDSSAETTAVAKPETKEKKPETKPKRIGDADDENPYDITALDESSRCPHCAKEMESTDAIICLHCGYNTQTRMNVGHKRVYATTFWDWCKWLGPGVFCVLLIGGLIGFDYWFVVGLKESVWDGWDKSLEHTSFSQGVRLWVVVMTVWVMWKSGKFAFNRLILNPRPPEIEKK